MPLPWDPEDLPATHRAHCMKAALLVPSKEESWEKPKPCTHGIAHSPAKGQGRFLHTVLERASRNRPKGWVLAMGPHVPEVWECALGTHRMGTERGCRWHHSQGTGLVGEPPGCCQCCPAAPHWWRPVASAGEEPAELCGRERTPLSVQWTPLSVQATPAPFGPLLSCFSRTPGKAAPTGQARSGEVAAGRCSGLGPGSGAAFLQQRVEAGRGVQGTVAASPPVGGHHQSAQCRPGTLLSHTARDHPHQRKTRPTMSSARSSNLLPGRGRTPGSPGLVPSCMPGALRGVWPARAATTPAQQPRPCSGAESAQPEGHWRSPSAESSPRRPVWSGSAKDAQAGLCTHLGAPQFTKQDTEAPL